MKIREAIEESLSRCAVVNYRSYPTATVNSWPGGEEEGEEKGPGALLTITEENGRTIMLSGDDLDDLERLIRHLQQEYQALWESEDWWPYDHRKLYLPAQ